MHDELPEDINKLVGAIIKRYGLDGVLLIACRGGAQGVSTHGTVGLAMTVPPHHRAEIVDAIADAAVDLAVDSVDAAQQQAATVLLN